MKNHLKYYRQYEKIMKTGLEQSVTETIEFQNFSEIYPNIAESIRLKREIKRLSKMMKSENRKGSKFKMKKEITIAQSKLRKNKLLKRLNGESKQEASFQRKFKRNRSKMRYSLLMKKLWNSLSQRVRKFQKKFERSMHKNLPPSLFNLRELDAAEKGIAVREWLQEKRNYLRQQVSSHL